MEYRQCFTILYIFYLFLGVVAPVTPSPRVCIIGAGYSGLSAARYMKEFGLNFKVFEASRYVGGTWRFDPHVGTDEDGVLPSFTSQYSHLRTNTPIQTMEFPGFPFPRDSPSFPTGTCFYKYMLAFAQNFDLLKNIQARSFVIWVQRMNNKWLLTYLKTDTRTHLTEECDFVVVSTGEYSTPSRPHFKNQETFKGVIIHSHDYKNAKDFLGQRVLLVGIGPSGLDIATQLVNVSARVVHSHHRTYNRPNYPPNFIQKPDIKHFTPTGAVFADDSIEEFNVVILCTGYHFNYVFLNYQSSGILAKESYTLPLHQNIVNINHPSMTFIGASKKVIASVLDIQAQYSAALAAGWFKLPSQDDMLSQWLNRVQTLFATNKNISDINFIGYDNTDQYFETLSKEASIPRPPPVIATIGSFNIKNIYEDFLHYRDYDYKIISDTQYERIYNPRNIVCPIVVEPVVRAVRRG